MALIAVEEGACGVCSYDFRRLESGKRWVRRVPRVPRRLVGHARASARSDDDASREPASVLTRFFDGVVPIQDQHANLYALASARELRRLAKNAPEADRRRVDDAIAVIGRQGQVQRIFVVFLLAFLGTAAL